MRLQPNQFGIALVVWLVVRSSIAYPQTSDVRWDTEPYRIRAWLAVDAPGELADRLATELPGYLDDRVVTAIGPAWRYETVSADAKLRQKMCRDIDGITLADLPVRGDNFDKELLLLIEATPWGYQLTAREFDAYTDHWSKTLVATTRQFEAVPEELFALVRRAVSPLAKVEADPRDPRVATLRIRAAALPPKSGDFQWVAPGDVLLPMSRRSTRDGALAEGGIQEIPWTYLELRPATAADGDNSAADAASTYTARVQSGMPAPLSRRRRARTELVAIAVRPDDSESSTLKLRSRTDETKPLVGYEVEAENLDGETAHPIGRSDERGELRVPSGRSNIQTLTIKSGGSVLARVPVVPGLGGEIEIRLPDDEVRLQAAARLASLREDLIDVVARRSIFAARVRRQIEDRNFDRARELMKELEDLPGATQFRQTLDREARLHKSKDPQVQRRIDQLFLATEVALSQFLDPRPISELRDELQQAQANGRETAQR